MFSPSLSSSILLYQSFWPVLMTTWRAYRGIVSFKGLTWSISRPWGIGAQSGQRRVIFGSGLAEFGCAAGGLAGGELAVCLGDKEAVERRKRRMQLTEGGMGVGEGRRGIV